MKRLLISIISVVSFLETFSQTGDIADQFIEAYRAARREIIHITLPNSFYLQGERVPLYAHLVDGITQRASNISEIAHIEIVNEEGQVMQSMSFQLEEGKFTGYLSIADSIPDGHYMVQSYTDWMKNFNPKSFFRAPIQIGSSPLPSESTTKVVKFYPEGGTWLLGVPNTILLEAIYKPYDTPLRTSGYIIKDQLDTVAEISTNDAGLAVFQLIPETGSVYVYVDGNDRYPLDQFKENGAKLAVQELSSYVIVSAFYDSQITGNDSYKIFMHLRGRPVFESEPLKGSQQKITFNKANLNAGLYEVLLVGSENNEILSKRLFYIDTPGTPTARLEKDQLKNRETTEIVVDAGSPLNGLLLVDKRNAYSSTLPLYLSINSFLDKPIRRKIFENQKYINYNLIGREQILLDMQSLIRGAAPNIEHSARKDFVLSGTLYNRANEPLANKDIKMISVNSGLNFSGSTNESGQFQFKIISILRDQQEKYLALVSENGNRIYDFRIKWDKTTSYPNFSRYFRKLEISSEAVTQKIELAQVQESYTSKMDDNQPFSVSSFYAKPDRTVDLSKYVKMPNFDEILREYLPMARIQEDQGRKFLQVTYGDENPKGPALVLINGEAIKDHSDLWKLDVNLIRKFDILYIANPQLTYFGDYLYGGLISVYTDENVFSVYDIEPITFDNPEAHLRYSTVKYQHQTDDPRFPLLKLNFFYDFTPSEKVYSFKAGDVDGHYHLNYFGFDENYNPFNQIKSIEVISN